MYSVLAHWRTKNKQTRQVATPTAHRAYSIGIVSYGPNGAVNLHDEIVQQINKGRHYVRNQHQ